MAIKGKNKAKSKPHPTARAPRREPVVIKPPLFQRRWLQVTGAFLLGLFAAMLMVWVTNGLRQNDAEAASTSDAASRRAAATAWQRQVETDLGTVGTVQAGAPPQLFPAMNATLDAMKKGTLQPTASDTLAAASKGAAAATKSLSAFDVAGTIRDQGFDQAQARAFTDSQERLITALTLYQRAADVGVLATEASQTQQETLTATADELRTDAATELQQAWLTYGEALSAGGINITVPAGALPGLGG